MSNPKTRWVVTRIKSLFPRRRVPILMYHQIKCASRNEDPLGLRVSPERFDKQMKLLSEARFRSISLDEFVARTDGGRKYLWKTFVLTFDDGHLDTYTNAFPILLKYGLTATVFPIANYLGKTLDWGINKPVRLMTWEQAREMVKNGISFQSHTCTHPDLTKLDDQSVRRELVDSKTRIEDALSLQVRHFAYPQGRYTQRIIELVKEAGYHSAYAAGLTHGGRFSIERFDCDAYSLKFRIESCAWGCWLRRIRNLPKGIMWHGMRKIHGESG